MSHQAAESFLNDREREVLVQRVDAIGDENELETWLYGDENRAVEEEQADVEDETAENDPMRTPKSKKKNSYTIARKLEVVEYAKKSNSISSAAKKYNIDRHVIRDWKAKEAQLRRTKESVKGANKKNLAGAGRPLLDKAFDDILAGWVRERRAMKQKVSRAMIMQKAAKMFQPVFGPAKEIKFSASEGWLQKFLDRHGFRPRAPTTRCQRPPEQYAQKLVDFVMYLSRIRANECYTNIYAADETPIWLDPTLGKCIDFKGAKDVTVLSTGHEKSRITVMLTARSDGQKSLPYTIHVRRRPMYTLNGSTRDGKA